MNPLPLIAWIILGLAGLWSADKDARSWVTWQDQFTHPYSTRSKVLVLGWIITILPMMILTSL